MVSIACETVMALPYIFVDDIHVLISSSEIIGLTPSCNKTILSSSYSLEDS